MGTAPDSLARNREDGLLPFCIVGTAGTANSGAVADLQKLAELAHRDRLRFHVDGAFGAALGMPTAVRQPNLCN